MAKLKICIIAEGCYPYVVGGVSSWIQSLIKSFQEYEFIVQALTVDRNKSGRFAYQIPNNVSQIYETYLQDDDFLGEKRKKKISFTKEEIEALEKLIFGETIEWDKIFQFFDQSHKSLNQLLMSKSFLEIATKLYQKKYPNLFFSDFLWTLRSMYLPLFYTLNTKMPKADLYHSISTGYAGILGSMAKEKYKVPFLVSEHGIYTREREEELIKAKWVKGSYKDVWIGQFYKMSQCAYQYADKVTSLFEDARELQIDLGCPKEKTIVTPNGIDMAPFQKIQKKEEKDTFIHCGAILRVTPIKDVKTMILAFSHAKEKERRLKLWIMGPLEEEPEYVGECRQLVNQLGVTDVIFTGRILVKDYLGKMDMILLTSISEGQPLSILEAFAAKKPCIVTNVGNCRGLIEGEQDNYGPAGIVTPVMSVDKITEAILTLAEKESLRKEMGERGFLRCKQFYSKEQMIQTYQNLYESLFDAYRKG